MEQKEVICKHSKRINTRLRATNAPPPHHLRTPSKSVRQVDEKLILVGRRHHIKAKLKGKGVRGGKELREFME